VSDWIVEYYDEGEEDWAEISGARFEEITDELNGHLEAVFCLSNTSTNRSFVETSYIIQIRYGFTQKFLGVLYDIEYSRKELKCIVYNGIFELLKRRVISGEYLGLMASSVADYIKTAAGLTYMINCPSTTVDIVFDQTLCFDAIVQLAQQLGKDYWVQYGDSLNIGDRGSAQSFDYSKAQAKERVVGRSKNRDKVHVRGVDNDGEEIMGVAGTGDDVAIFWWNQPATEDALDAIAAAKLAEINQDDSSVTLVCPIGEGVHLDPGDTITVVKPLLNLNDSYRIVKVVKRRKDMDIEIIRSKRDTEKILEELCKESHGNFSLTTFLSQFGGEGTSLPYGVGFGNPILGNIGFTLTLDEEFDGSEGEVYTELSLDCDVTCEENFEGNSGDVYVNNGIDIEVSFETP
jgi:hypothetical protein